VKTSVEPATGLNTKKGEEGERGKNMVTGRRVWHLWPGALPAKSQEGNVEKYGVTEFGGGSERQ